MKRGALFVCILSIIGTDLLAAHRYYSSRVGASSFNSRMRRARYDNVRKFSTHRSSRYRPAYYDSFSRRGSGIAPCCPSLGYWPRISSFGTWAAGDGWFGGGYGWDGGWWTWDTPAPLFVEPVGVGVGFGISKGPYGSNMSAGAFLI